jgi:MarR family transcriptional regulator, lower aerobic nicotinate degradation pathway regulator
MTKPAHESAESSEVGPDQRTGALLQSAHQWTRRLFNDALRPTGIETRHLGVLTALSSGEELNQKQLVDRLELDKSAVVLILDDLERLGLAQRQRNPRDRRAHTLQLTEDGRRRLRTAQEIATGLGRKVFAGLTKSDRERLDRILSQIIENCRAERAEVNEP